MAQAGPQPKAASGGLSRADALTIQICSLAYLLDGLVHTILGPLAPEMARTLGLSNPQLGPIFSANLIGQCLGLVLFPLAVGRLGHRGVVVVTLFGFGVFQALSGLAEGAQSLFLLRLGTGFFLGGALPSCLAMVTAAAPPARRGFMIAVLFTGYAIGCTLAGLASAAFAGIGGWRVAMAVVGGLCLVTALVAWRTLHEPALEPGATQGAAGHNPLVLLSRDYWIGTLALWVLFISMLTISYCLNSWLPILLVQVGRDPALAGISVSIFSLGGIVAALGVGALIDAFGATRVLVTFLLVSSALVFAIGQLLESASTPLLLALLAASGFFALGAYGGINVVLASYYPAALRARGIGVTKSVGRVGTVLAPILVGWALGAGVAETLVMSLFALPLALAALALLVIAGAQRGKVE